MPLYDDFNPRSPWGERLVCPGRQSDTDKDFNPRSPWGERLEKKRQQATRLKFQSTLPVGGATAGRCGQGSGSVISIHAPRGGSDWCVLGDKATRIKISIHAPRGGSDAEKKGVTPEQLKFQSTLPVGGAT